MLYSEKYLTGGVLPLFTPWAALRENGSSVIKPSYRDSTYLDFTVDDVKEFLWKIGFIEYNEYILTFIATCVWKSAKMIRLKMRTEYKNYVQDGQNEVAFRTQLAYYINKNYDRVHENVVKLCGFPMTVFFNTNKMFIETLSSVFVVYGKTL